MVPDVVALAPSLAAESLRTERMKKTAPMEVVGYILAQGWEGKMEILVKILFGTAP
jgi:hypothetical protein